MSLGVAGILAVLAALGCFPFKWRELQDRYAQRRVESYIRRSQAASRNTAARLAGAPYAAYQPDAHASDELGRAQLLALRLPDSSRSRYLQSLIDVGTGNWTRAAEELSSLADAHDADEAVLNDVGVAFLELSRFDALYMMKALEQFDRAAKRNSRAPEPHYNRLVVLRKLHLKNLETTEVEEYSKLETERAWRSELPETATDETETLAKLQAALNQRDAAAATAIFKKAPEFCRRMAMQFATNPVEAPTDENVAEFVARTIQQQYGDQTLSAMLSSLEGPHRVEVIEARQLVARGAELYLKSDPKASMEAYEKAADLLENVSSPFDHLWIDLNRANTELRLLQPEGARVTLDSVVRQARANEFKWILASALTAYGTATILSSSFTEMMDRLDEAIRLFDNIGAPAASARARFYIMGQKIFGGDMDGAIRTAVAALLVADPADHIRLASVLATIAPALYKKGLVSGSIAVSEESVSQAEAAKVPSLMLATNANLAIIREFTGQPKAADEALQRSIRAVQAINEAEKTPAQVSIDNVKARILLHRGAVREAESLLERSAATVEAKLSKATWVRTETRMLLGQAYVQDNKIREAEDAFRETIDIAEKDNDFVKTERSRVAFDDGRRELYDSAIGFEYTHGSTDAAWTYVQKYRAKLFIEQLAQFNPDIERVHAIALDRNQVQRAIPENLQIVEYALLPDRTLMWIVTNKTFEARSVAVRRDVIEQKVSDFLDKLRHEKPVADESAELYRLLFAPIEPLLDRNRALAIIPDRALHGLPFAALGIPESGYLVEHYSILESPTLTHLLAADRRKPSRDDVTTFGSRTDDLETREVGAMQTIYHKVTPFSGPDVTKTAFLDAMQHASVFHYAGHSAHDAADPLRSSILLDGDTPGPNSVTAVDIVGHKLQPNSVVVLSSCDSSVGNSKDGVGIRGLTSAFLISGAGSVVGSLWPVESGSTAELMIAFHRAFAAQKLSVADAMRKAQLAFLKSNPKHTHPYYWSGFAVTGNSSALQ